MKTKILSVIAAVAVAMTSFVSLAVTASAAGDITATFNNGVLTISGTGDMPNYSQVFRPWADHKNDVTSVVIEEGVTSIGNNAFSDHSNLRSITIPSTVKTIEFYALSRSGLTSVTIPSSVTTICEGAFQGCKSLSSVTFSEGLTTIERYAFHSCSNLTSVTLPSTIKTIGSDVFASCSSLTTAYYCGTEAEWNANVDASSFWKSYSTQLIFIGAPAANKCGDNVTWTLDNGTLTISGTGAMYNYDQEYDDNPAPWYDQSSSITSIVIGDGVTSIGNWAFSYCDHPTSVTIPSSVTSIGKYAFYNCTGLKSITIPDSVTSIGDSAFMYCSRLTSVTIPDGVTSIGMSAFSSCENLTSVTIPDGVTSIGGYAFFGCSRLPSIEIPNSVTSIGECAFDYCAKLTSVTIPSSVTSIGEEAFADCAGLTSITYEGTALEWEAVTVGNDWKPNNAKVYVKGSNTVSNLKAYTYSFFHDVGATAFLASFTADDAHKLGDVTWYITSNGETRKTDPLSYGDLDVTSEPTEVVYVVTDLKDANATAKATYEQAGYVEYE